MIWGKKTPITWAHVPPKRLGNCSGWNLICWGRRKEQFLAKGAPWHSSRHVHVSAGIAIRKNLGRRGLRQAALPLLMSASTHISLSGLRIHTLCNSEQVSIDGFLFWHTGCSSPTQIYSQSWFKNFPPWIPRSSLLVPSSAMQFLVPSVGRQIYKPHCKPVTAAILPTDSVYSKGLPTAAAWLMASLQESSSPI